MPKLLEIIFENVQIIERWKSYYGKLLNEDNPRTVFGDGVPNEGLTPASGRGTERNQKWKGDGTRRIPVDVWKNLGEEGVDMLDLLQKIFEQEKMPEE